MIKRLNIYYWLRKLFISRFIQKYLNQNFVRKFIFYLIYKTNHWNRYQKINKNNILVSGPGSIPGSIQTKNIIDNLDFFIKKNNIKSILDMPCGDFSWMQDLIKKNNYINYTGYDIVEDIIFYNNKKYYVSINKILDNIKRSKVKFVACSNNNNAINNKDIAVGQHRKINLTIEPFYMNEIFYAFSEGVDDCYINIYKI
jgi:hypothetical protein